uniref:Uncharacterized protein n=1 Tax=Anguilla anguilla TaxID=7936 RepID=A0A0E9WTE1_ANGAN
MPWNTQLMKTKSAIRPLYKPLLLAPYDYKIFFFFINDGKKECKNSFGTWRHYYDIPQLLHSSCGIFSLSHERRKVSARRGAKALLELSCEAFLCQQLLQCGIPVRPGLVLLSHPRHTRSHAL